ETLRSIAKRRQIKPSKSIQLLPENPMQFSKIKPTISSADGLFGDLSTACQPPDLSQSSSVRR
ncbi:hypothetical protein, partial [Pseudoroseomonas ludipueritiae]|uniref:hypothetical protein n=1 Tax=Pseudoroseomonas ludipueritiae TaxID=198093 RepID=UPI00362E5527